MKQTNTPRFRFPGNPLKVASVYVAAENSQKRTPYLKAILSGTMTTVVRKNNLPEENPDRTAALRYIRESENIKRTLQFA